MNSHPARRPEASQTAVPALIDPLTVALASIAAETDETETWSSAQVASIDFVALQQRLLRAATASSQRHLSRWACHDLAQIFTALNFLIDDNGDAMRSNIGAADLEQGIEMRRLVRVLHYASENLLAVAKGGALSIKQTLPLEAVVDTAVQNTAYAARAAGVVVEHVRSPTMVNVSRFTVEQVLSNLIVNAIEAIETTVRERAGSRTVTISYEPRGNRVIVSVQDDGPGIQPPIVDKVFACGYSTRTAASTRGFGLTICAYFVNSEGGSLVLLPPDASRPGAHFTFDLEAAPTPVEEPDLLAPVANCG